MKSRCRPLWRRPSPHRLALARASACHTLAPPHAARGWALARLNCYEFDGSINEVDAAGNVGTCRTVMLRTCSHLNRVIRGSCRNTNEAAANSVWSVGEFASAPPQFSTLLREGTLHAGSVTARSSTVFRTTIVVVRWMCSRLRVPFTKSSRSSRSRSRTRTMPSHSPVMS